CSLCSTASEILPYEAAVHVARTLRSTSYGSSLSALTVTSCEVSAASRAAASSPAIGRCSTLRKGSISCVRGSLTSARLATVSPCTRSASFVTITTTDCFGCTSVRDCGMLTPLEFCSTSTSVEYTSRNATLTE